MTTLPTTLLAFIVALAVLIVVHEFGHFLVARWCGVKVLRFSLGFGKVIASRRFGNGETEWALSAIPFGGYVKMLDERESDTPIASEELPRAFNRQNVWKRFAIVLAGPTSNFLLAILLYWIIFLHGVPGIKPVIGAIAPQTPAANAGLAVGDIITQVGDQAVTEWQETNMALLKYAADHATIDVMTDNGVSHRLDLSGIKSSDFDSNFLTAVGITSMQPPLDAVVGKLIDGGVAQNAGLRVGDRIVRIGDVAIDHWDDAARVISSHAEQALDFEVERAGQKIALSITPAAVQQEDGTKIGRIGIAPKIDEAALQSYFVTTQYAPVPALGQSLKRTWDMSAFSLRMFGKMLVGEVSFKNLSGPITIAEYAGESARIGWLPYLIFLALVSISLGVLNLLPIPLLDGGHLMYYTVEIIKGSPVSDRIIEIGQRVGMAALLLLMACALYNDIARHISS